MKVKQKRYTNVNQHNNNDENCIKKIECDMSDMNQLCVEID